MMSRLGGEKGVIRQTEFFLYSQRDREALEACRSMNLRYPEITGWIRAVKEDVPLVKEMGLKETGILTSVSDYTYSSSWASHGSRPWKCTWTWCGPSSKRGSSPGAISRTSPGRISTAS